MTNPNSDSVWSGHFIHRWTKWKDLVITTTISRGDEPAIVERVERIRYRVCDICGLEQRGR